jgi:pimeloyl-ACP methyl ester carboxylesterase
MADADMLGAAQGLAAFLRAYYHGKSGDWPENQPFPLAAWSAAELARMPTYYIMDAAAGMAETVGPMLPSPAETTTCQWLTDAELAVYVDEYSRTGFQGGLNWYRATIDGGNHAERLFAGGRIEVPCTFIAGARDWGIYQRPGGLDAMATRACSDYGGTHLIEGAGHWVQQERPEAVVAHILGFVRR